VVKPTVLLATTSRWYPTARLGMALSSAGCKVEAVCPSLHPLRKTRAIRRTHAYHGLAPLTSFARAIAVTQPDFIVPGDDLATQHLHRLYSQERHAQEQRDGRAGSPICALIERSLGKPESFAVVSTRAAFMNLAREEGLRVPATEVIHNTGDLRKWLEHTGLPTVLKANGTSGGEGVRIVHTTAEAERALNELHAPPLLARAVKRALFNHDNTLLWPSLLRHRPVVNAQAFVAGREATSTIVCWKGAVLASLHFEVVHKASSRGHATVVRLIENAEMSAAVEAMVRRLGLSGFHGFDFIIETGTGNACLIEINPRSAQVGHLSLGPGRNLPAALYAALCGETAPTADPVTNKDTIALFPQEWMRDPGSSFLQSAYHDVPWEEPELVRDCVSRRRTQTTWRSPSAWKSAFKPARSPKPSSGAAKGHTVGLDWGGK